MGGWDKHPEYGGHVPTLRSMLMRLALMVAAVFVGWMLLGGVGTDLPR